MPNNIEAGPSDLNLNINNGANTYQINVHVQANMQGRYNCARDFYECREEKRFSLPVPKICPFCNTRLFCSESSTMCCMKGKISFPSLPISEPLMDLFCEQSEQGRHFRQFIQSYNHNFAFTSMGVHVDDSMASTSRGIHTFRAQGSIYHKIGSLLPTNDRPRYLQLYIYDADNEIEHRLSESRDLRAHIVQRVKTILDRENPFVKEFRQLAQREDLHQCIFMLCHLILCQIYLPMNADFILMVLILTAHLIIGNVGHRTILPSSFVGSPHDMIQRFQDAMNLVQKFGKPDLFNTMTCNPG
ncbi:hypothetical protein SO802_028938 [Lithocarpus litseifolius]|uniref:Helitron helicase-like domain-containing protein n=1 Tax=Lithocarpus litseifolius TaxID=425828 RepID=A0AAW2BV77_9ROSI